MQNSDRYYVGSVGKALKVLEYVGRCAVAPNLTQISKDTAIPKSTLLNILHTLEQNGYVRRDENGQTYLLGTRLLELGYCSKAEFDVIRFALPVMEELQIETGLTVYLSTHREGRVFFLESVYPNRRAAKYSSTGKVLPMHCTASGKAMLSHLPKEAVDAVVSRYGLSAVTGNSITDESRLFAELEAIRERGYAIDNEEESLGVRCAAVVIRRADGMPVGALSVSASAYEMDEEKVAKTAAALSAAAVRISEQADKFPFSLL